VVVGSLAMVPPGTVSSVSSPMGEKVRSETRKVRSFIG